MVTRTWHGVVLIKFENEFERHLGKTGVSETTSIRWNISAFVKIR